MRHQKTNTIQGKTEWYICLDQDILLSDIFSLHTNLNVPLTRLVKVELIIMPKFFSMPMNESSHVQ